MDYIVAEASGDELRISIDPKINSVSNIHVTVTVPDNGQNPRTRSLERLGNHLCYGPRRR